MYEQYRILIEEAYNFRQSDSAISDFSEFKAIKLLNKMNKLRYLEMQTNTSANN